MVMMLESEHQVKFDSMETQLIEEKEIAVNDVEMQRDKENYQHETRYDKLQEDFGKLKR